MWNKLPYHSVMCDMRTIQNGIHMRGDTYFAFEDSNMAPVPSLTRNCHWLQRIFVDTILYSVLYSSTVEFSSFLLVSAP